MRENSRKRVLALMLCLVMACTSLLSNGTVFAGTTDVNGEEPLFEDDKSASEVLSPAFEATYNDGTVEVKVSAAEGILPEGVELVVNPITEGDNYTEAAEKFVSEAEAQKKTVTGFKIYDISFMLDGIEVEPNGDVNVQMQFIDPIVSAVDSEAPEALVLHLNEDGVAEEVQATAEVEGASLNKVEFSNNSFSPYAILTTTEFDSTVYEYSTPISNGDVDNIKLTKTATDTTQEGDAEQTFDINLSVQGMDFTQTSPVDITLVIDNSSSMANSKRMDITQKAVKAFIDEVMPQNNQSVRVSLVKYGREAYAYDFNSEKWIIYTGMDRQWYSQYYTSDGEKAKGVVKGIEANGGGTNTEGGFLTAKAVTDRRNNDADSIVIFMTDGVPTFRYNNSGTAVSGSSGVQTSKEEFNEAVTAAKNLKESNNNIYTIGLLTGISSQEQYNNDTVAECLLTDKATYKAYGDEGNLYFSKQSNFSYSSQYDSITKEEGADTALEEIYRDIAQKTIQLATGTVTDRIPDGFELVSADGWEISADQRTLTYKNVKATVNQINLPTIKVKYVGDGYGAAYTNTAADYTGKLYNGKSFAKDFPKPVAGVHPKTTDDVDVAFVDEDKIINVRDNDPFEKLVVPGYEISDYELVITDENGNPHDYTDQNESFVAYVNEDGTVTFHSSTTSPKTFYYVVKAKITKVGDDFATNGKIELISRPTKVDVTLSKKVEFSFEKTDENGKPVAGAEFTIAKVDAPETVIYRATSTMKNGKAIVEFGFLPPGNYVMKESVTPTGYVPSNEEWTVEIKADGTTIIKNKAGQEVTSIKNNSYESALEKSKTVQLVDWNERTYKITLQASSLLKNSYEKENPVDIVLVMDSSGSMRWDAQYTKLYDNKRIGDLDKNQMYYFFSKNTWYELMAYGNYWYYRQADYTTDSWKYIDGDNNRTIYTKSEDESPRIDVVKQAAKAFVDDLRINSPNSNVAIVDFDSQLQKATKLFNVSEEYSSIITAINGMKAEGGTSPGLGLRAAEGILNNAVNSKYVMLLTDGAPTSNGEPELTEQWANSIKEPEKNTTLMTIGVSLTQETGDWLKELASDPKYAFNASNSQEILDAFDFVKQSIQTGLSIDNAVIRDYIDPRFEIVDEEAVIASGGRTGKDDSGNIYIEWNTSILPKGNDDTPGWKKEILIRAKDEYIGGNDVTTNGEKSGIIVDGSETMLFERPTVNVKVDFNVGAEEDTIFLGEDLVKYFTDGKANSVTALQSTTGKTYTMLDDVTISTEWYADKDHTQKINIEEIRQQKPTDTTVYYAVVTVKPKTDGSASKENMVGDGQGNKTSTDFGKYYAVEENGVTREGTYTVKVVSGSIVIEKTVNKVNAGQGDAVFTFAVKNETTGVTYYRTVRFDKTSTSQQSKSVTIDNLPQGKYSVTELKTMRYDWVSTTWNGIGSYPANKDNNNVYLGLETDGTTTDLDSRDGKAAIENRINNDDHHSDTDSVTNKFSKGDDGKIHVSIDYGKNK